MYTGQDLTTITDTVGRQVALTYDSAHHLVRLQEPDGRRIVYSYDSAGHLVSVRDRATADGSTGTPYRTAVQADAPTAYWPLDETSGTSAADLGATPAAAGTYSGGTLGVASLIGDSGS